jgi:hypothetical protein
VPQRSEFEPQTVYYLFDSDEYHATPRCPQVKPGERQQLLVVEAQGDWPRPLDRWCCETCCPVDLVIPAQTVYRLPVYFHADANCPERPEELREQSQSLEMIQWPTRNYHEIVSDDGTAWKADGASRRSRGCVLSARPSGPPVCNQVERDSS